MRQTTRLPENLVQVLDAHQFQREQGSGCVSFLIGPRLFAARTACAWADRQGRAVASPMAPEIEPCVAAYAALLRELSPEAREVSGATIPTPAELKKMLDSSSIPAPVLFLTDVINRDTLRTGFYFAGIVPIVPLFTSGSDETSARLRDLARGDEAASLFSEGFVTLPPESEIETAPREQARLRKLSRAQSEALGSSAERFLDTLLAKDPVTRGLFTQQGQLSFQMGNNQPARVDFLCEALSLAIEIDGPLHDDEEQRQRDERKAVELARVGILLLRFEADEVVDEFEKVRREIRQAVWRQRQHTTH